MGAGVTERRHRLLRQHLSGAGHASAPWVTTTSTSTAAARASRPSSSSAASASSPASWARILDGVAPTTRVCAYDRAGQGWSDDVEHPQDGIAAAEDLHALLAAAGETGPFVLVGHSIGGPYAMTYADHYADEVAGMVLLDSTSPEQFTAIPSYPTQYAMMRRAYGVMPTLARLGLGVALAGSHLPADDAAPVDAMSATPRAGRNARDELSMLPVVFEQARALTTLGDRPLVVLTSAENAATPMAGPQAQEHMAALSSDAVTREAARQPRRHRRGPGRSRSVRAGHHLRRPGGPHRDAPPRRAEPAPTRWNPAIRPVRRRGAAAPWRHQATTTQAVRTMDRISTISDTTQVRPPAGETTDVCWCGQDMDLVRGRHCPRCGTARAARFDAPLPRLAA